MKFAHLALVKDSIPRVGPENQREGLSFANEICRRTGLNCWFNLWTGCLFFAYGDAPSFGVLNVEFYRKDGTIRKYTSSDRDDLVRGVQSAKHLSLAEKERVEAANAKQEADEREAAMQQQKEDRRQHVESRAGFLSRQRRGVQTVGVIKE